MKKNITKKLTRSFLAAFLAAGLFLGATPYEARADTNKLDVFADITASGSGNSITLTCNVSGPPDDATKTYQWKKNGQVLSGKTGNSITVNSSTDAGTYECTITATTLEVYELINDAYKAFLHRQAVESNCEQWRGHLYNNDQDPYLYEILNDLGTPQQNEAAKVAGWTVFSYEYLSKFKDGGTDYSGSVNTDTENNPKQLIVDCYKFFCQRTPGNDEVEYWYSVYENNNNDGTANPYGYPDGNGINQRLATYKGIGVVINGIADSDQAKANMAARYYYNGDTRRFLYDKSSSETRTFTGSTSASYTVKPPSTPSPSPTKYKVTVNKGTGISSVSGDGSYEAGAKVTVNATVKTGYTLLG